MTREEIEKLMDTTRYLFDIENQDYEPGGDPKTLRVSFTIRDALQVIEILEHVGSVSALIEVDPEFPGWTVEQIMENIGE